jgi:hydroxymethylpyrimidine pyrophosphatase-like HAD family hydrolase
MFFGDNLNDYDAVKWAGVGVAVANAKDKLKEVADVILDETNDQGAVGKFLLELLEK